MENISYIIISIIFVCSLRFDFSSNEEVKLPPGHLLPLGHQTLPTVDIDEFSTENVPTPDIFFHDYMKQGKAAIFRGAMLNTKAFKLWTDEYIKVNYGSLEVRLEAKHEKTGFTPIGEKYLGRDTLGHFVDNYKSPKSSTYIVSELPKPMYKDVGVLPSLGACGELKNTFVEIDLWWSGGGSKSIIHKDAFNQINCLYRGKKHWKLFEYKYEKWLYQHYEGEREIGGFSEVDVNAVDLIKHPDFIKVPWSNFTLEAGDCLFLPKSYYHQVDSDGPNNLAVSILYSRLDNKTSIDTSDCNDETDYRIPRPLSDFEVMWEWEGQGVMSMGHIDLEYLRSEVAKIAQKSGEMMSADTLRKSVFGSSAGDGRTTHRPMEAAISAIDRNGDGMASLSEVKLATKSQLRRLAEVVEPYEPSNTYEFEYSHSCYWNVLETLQQTIRENVKFSRQQWIEAYLEKCGGTKPFADEIFTGLVESPTTSIVTSENISDDDINRALKNWVKYWSPPYCDREEKPPMHDEDDDDESSPEEDLEEDNEKIVFANDNKAPHISLKEEL